MLNFLVGALLAVIFFGVMDFDALVAFQKVGGLRFFRIGVVGGSLFVTRKRGFEIKRVGGLTFVKLGSFGGSFYVAA